ncbi:MAG: hypothetical protein JXR76_02980 [Deltaproteobacteria bacterium]|nr:hypothetical protein [Deltaproteobacteria bacterium]
MFKICSRRWSKLWIATLGLCITTGCGDDKKEDGTSNPRNSDTTPFAVASGEFTYRLMESGDNLPLWTTPVTHKINQGARPPESIKSGITLSAARNEFESIQLIIGPAGGEVTISFTGFENLDGQRMELAVAEYEETWVERLRPISFGTAVTLNTGYAVPVWMTLYIPKSAAPGIHTGAITVTQNGTPIQVPLELCVFNFELPDEIHFSTQLNISMQSLMADNSEETVKTMLFEHRMTPKSVTWPSGFNWGITWDSGSNPQRCSQFYDEPDEGAEYAIGALAPKYILGEGWNGIGFPNAMLFQFVDNSTPRPDTFCDVSLGDHFGSAAYNAQWANWLSALDSYLVTHGMDEKAYYYVQNEPQNASDEALAAHLCRITKAAAPNLRIAISEEPKPSIAEDSGGACGYDIWIAHIRAYKEDYAWQRQETHGEQVWFYSLDHDPEPYFNPTAIDTPGMNQRIIPWAAWSHRITGWAYYDAGRFFDSNGHPGVRAELLREGFEDYEYLWLANGGAHPAVNQSVAVDATVKSVAASMVSWTKDADALMAVRHQLGRYIEGSESTLPVLQVESSRPAGNYYINFQDPNGEPLTSPLLVNGKEYMKIGWNEYDAELGYGWRGENMGTDILMTGYATVDGFNEVQRSYIYDDYGRDNLFEFDLAPGAYNITVGVGMAGRAYSGQPHNVSIEGVKVVDDEPTTEAQTLIERTVTMEITDGSLSMVAAGQSESIDDYSYTFVAYLEIELAD